MHSGSALQFGPQELEKRTSNMATLTRRWSSKAGELSFHADKSSLGGLSSIRSEAPLALMKKPSARCVAMAACRG